MKEYSVDERLKDEVQENYGQTYDGLKLPFIKSFKKHSVCYVLQSTIESKTGSIFSKKEQFLDILRNVFDSAQEFGRDYPIAHTIVLEKNRSIYNKRIRIKNLDDKRTYSVEIRSEEDIRKLENML